MSRLAPQQADLPDPSRRVLLKGAAAAGGALVVGFTFGRGARAAGEATFAPNAFIRVSRDSSVTVFLPKSEMGQGINTSIPMLLAEELDVPLELVRVAFCPPGMAGAISQVTGGSTTTQTTTNPLRDAGAKARTMLVEAASSRWAVAAQSCTTKDCKVLHVSTGRELAYGELVEAAARLPVPDKAVLKAAADFRIVGKPQRRLDSPAKVDGKPVFGIDAMPPGVKFASIAACPVRGGTLKSVDDAPAMAVKGVIKVVRLDEAVAVIADHTGAARAGLAALSPQWDLGPNATLKQADIVAGLEEASKSPGAVAHNSGDADKAMAAAAKTLDAVYHMPFLAHTPMEPINCTASVTKDGCEVWIGHQSPVAAQTAAAKACGLPPDKVTLHNHVMGGGFGRKVEIDMVDQAVRIAKTADYPVKLIWSREEDVQQDFYRPFYVDRLAAGLDQAGRPVAWTHRITGSSLMGRVFPPALAKNNGVDMDAVEASLTPYDLSNQHIEYVRKESGVRTGFWRGVGTTHNVFVTESFIDECAHAAGADPLAYRLALIKEPRLKAVVEAVAKQANWGQPLPAGWGRGISVQDAWKTLLAQVIEVEVTPAGDIKVHRVVCAADPGLTINPLTLQAQVQGGVVFGLTAALYDEVTFADGRVEQTNFGDYPMMRMRDAPSIDVILMESDAAPGGFGEAPTAGVAPALANAVFAATGVRVRELPLAKANLKKA